VHKHDINQSISKRKAYEKDYELVLALLEGRRVSLEEDWHFLSPSAPCSRVALDPIWYDMQEY
jgi:hypothetical protein